MIFLTRYLPLAICFTMGVTFAVQYYVPHARSEALLTDVASWMIIIGGFTMILALASLIRSHAENIKRKSPGWGYSAVVFVGIVGTVIVGIISEGKSLTIEGVTTSFGWVYDNMFVPLQGTVFSLLACFMASAAFRAFRARTTEAGFLLIAAVVVMFGHVPLGEYIWSKIFTSSFLPIGKIVDWIMNNPNMAAQRGIRFGITLGVVATSLKIIFGIERAYMGGGKE